MKKRIPITLLLAFIIGLIPGVTNAKLVACVGDSITYGYGLPDRASNCYPAQLARILQEFDNQWETQNFGANGATLLRKGDQPYVRKGVYNPALASEPEVVIIMLGSNDSWPSNWAHKDDFITDYLALIDAFAELPGHPKIFICYPPPIWGSPWGLDNVVIRDEIIPLIDQLPTYREVQLIDPYKPLEESRHLFPDGVHPNTEGAKAIAEIVASVILGFGRHPDLNGDGIVDSADMCLMVDHWHTDEPLCDIAPPPFGDGIVDVRDLVVLAEHLLTYPGAVAYWKLDETEGILAHDSAGENDAYLVGDPTWQPAGGMADGAIQLDGVDDYIVAGPVLNPADGPFSVLAWIKGGSAGQAVMSEPGGANWLSIDPIEGHLMTDLTGVGRSGGPLLSQTVITEGNWHRIGLVWDGLNRTLYVDGIVAAQDTQDAFADSSNGLNIGCGTSSEPNSFFSGMIDDVRIYNRALTP